MCFCVTKTSGRGYPPDPRKTSARPKEAARHLVDGRREDLDREQKRDLGRAGQGTRRQRPADRAPGARGLPQRSAGRGAARNPTLSAVAVEGGHRGHSPPPPLRGTREVWPRRVGWLSGLKGVRQAPRRRVRDPAAASASAVAEHPRKRSGKPVQRVPREARPAAGIEACGAGPSLYPRGRSPLTAVFVKSVAKPGKYGDRHGLILQVRPTGTSLD